MLTKHIKELWMLRARKIFLAEKESYLFYRNLLEKNKRLLIGTRTKEILEQIKWEEVQHAKIARKLIRLIESKAIDE